MHETSKCFERRKEFGEFDKYLRGYGLDIGCGADILKVPEGHVRGWDKPQGDANHLRTLEDEQFDFVYSSHCLEHLKDVGMALANWVRVLKQGGCLYVVVPDYEYYEKQQWPSRYNPKHRHSFSQTVTRGQAGRDNHWHLGGDLWPLYDFLGVDWIEDRLELDGFDFSEADVDQTKRGALSQICIIGVKR